MTIKTMNKNDGAAVAAAATTTIETCFERIDFRNIQPNSKECVLVCSNDVHGMED